MVRFARRYSVVAVFLMTSLFLVDGIITDFLQQPVGGPWVAPVEAMALNFNELCQSLPESSNYLAFIKNMKKHFFNETSAGILDYLRGGSTKRYQDMLLAAIDDTYLEASNMSKIYKKYIEHFMNGETNFELVQAVQLNPNGKFGPFQAAIEKTCRELPEFSEECAVATEIVKCKQKSLVPQQSVMILVKSFGFSRDISQSGGFLSPLLNVVGGLLKILLG